MSSVFIRFTFLSTVVIAMSLSTGCNQKNAKHAENTLNLYSVSKIKGLDPSQSSDQEMGIQVSLAYEGLLQYHYLKRPYKLEPAIADGMPEVKGGGKEFVFKIKKGVLFQDDPAFKKTNGKGREVTADDFVYSFKRLADPTNRSTGWWIFDERIQGLNEWRDEAQKSGTADYEKKVAGLYAPDRYTLVIKLTKPSFQFLYFLAMPFTFVVPREAVEHYGKDFSRNPVGTGPYVLDRANSNLDSKLVWDRNPTYRDAFYPSEGDKGDKEEGLLEDAGKKLPISDRVIYTIYVESQPLWLNFLAGKVDASGIPKDNFASAITPSKEVASELATKGIRLITGAMLDITHESFNMRDPILGKNKKLRQAISMAVNPVPLMEKFYNNRAIPAQGPIPPGLSGYDPNFKNPYRQFNLTKAKQLLKEAGYPEGKGLPVMEYASTSSTTARQMAEFYARSLSKLGIRLKVSTYTWPEFMKTVRNGKGQMWGYAWLGDYPDAENFLQLFYSKNVSPGPNDSNYQNPKFDKLYEKALTMPPGAEREKLYKQMVEMVVEDCPWVFGVHRLGYGLVHPWLHNFKRHDFEHAKAKYYRVDYKLRAKKLQ